MIRDVHSQLDTSCGLEHDLVISSLIAMSYESLLVGNEAHDLSRANMLSHFSARKKRWFCRTYSVDVGFTISVGPPATHATQAEGVVAGHEPKAAV